MILQDFRADKKIYLALCAILAITFLCFSPALFNGFLSTWDDGNAVIDNPNIRNFSFNTILWAFTSFYCEDWIPLTWVSFAFDYALWGLNPFGYHLTNVILHAINAGMFFVLSLNFLSRFADEREDLASWGNRPLFAAVFAALFFSLHPLRVESVAWIMERKDVLSLFFGIPAILAYTRHASFQHAARTAGFIRSPFYWLALCLFALSLSSKTMLVTLPALLLILDFFPFGRIHRSSVTAVILEKIPFFSLSAIVIAIILTAHTSSSMPLSESDIVSRLFIAAKSIISYLVFTIWPVGLNPFHLHPGNINPSHPEYLLPAAIVATITASSLFLARSRPFFPALWFTYIVSLLPVLGFSQVVLTAMADRYTYAPGMVLSIAAAAGVSALLNRFQPSKVILPAFSATLCLLLLCFGFLTIRQISYWKDDITLWSRAIQLKPHTSGRMYNERASAYMERGEFTSALTDMNEAINIAERKNRPNMEELYFKRANIFRALGMTEAADSDYAHAVMLKSRKQL